ncbi:hypothetical protein EDC94DRAFT_590826 [Helicostylum pulchrum]|uniref:Uncharacterized protein n=1 Tax=Helicostylum pulchrum TaxID=562976 RepID=A0ABP9YI43_9FUNG|nr:hypothetical protein EDC94DRAFT_590826 [Helicostylum pulchrum]
MNVIALFSLLLTLPISILAIYGTGDGLILLTSDQNTRSGVLSADHRCTNFPQKFKAALVKNTGSSHCALWSDADCKGTLHVVPAHYTMKIPREHVESVIC